MKKLNATISLMIAGTMLLASCSATNDQSNTPADLIKGAYVQNLINLPQVDGEVISSYHVSPEGQLVAYDYQLKHTYTSTDDGANWTQSDGPIKALTDSQYVNQLAPDTKGGLYLVMQDINYEDGQSNISLMYADSAGETSPVDIPELNQALSHGSDTYINRIASLSADRLLLSYSYSAAVGTEDQSTAASGASVSYSDGDVNYYDLTAVFDPGTGQKIYELTDFGGTFAVNASHLFSYDYENGLKASDLQTGQEDTTVSYAFPGDGGANCMAATDDGMIFALVDKDIYKLLPDGSNELLLSGDGYSFGRQTAYVDSLSLLPDSSLLMTYSSGIIDPNDNGTRLLQLMYDAEASIDPAKALKIWGLNDNETVRDAVIDYRREHPDSEVSFDVALNWDGSVTQEDAVKTLNNLILTGDGPDVLLLDGLTVQNYAERGLLLDLSEKLDLTDLLSPVAAASQSGKAVYWVPARFKTPIIAALSQTDLDLVTDSASLLEQVQAAPAATGIDYETSDDPFASLSWEERAALGFADFDELFSFIWNTSAPQLLTDQGLDESVLQQMLTAFKTINDRCGDMTKEDYQGYALGYGGSFSTQTITGSAAALMTQRTRYALTLLDSIAAFEGLSTQAEPVYKLYPGIAQGTWLPVGVVGISAASKVQDLALDLVKALLSAEVQAGFTEGIPVTQQGVAGQVSTIDQYYKKQYNDILTYLNEHPDEQTPDVQTYLDQLPQGFSYDIAPLLDAMQQPLFSDQVVYDKVESVARAFCQGQQSLQAASTQLQQDLRSYLAEQE
ncbi:hypothetical protein HCH52_02215 [Oscillospiraceae bacterium HV4-5-C5C]|nr:hypothetical protein [Oscillospiraceae bacterium HV4-5-C5C]